MRGCDDDMLFNSTEFLFAFLPIVWCGYAIAARLGWSRGLVVWLGAASYVFYGWVEPRLVVLLALSTVFNFIAGWGIARARDAGRERSATLLCGLAVAADLVLLGYFKYTNFLLETLGTLGAPMSNIARIALPIGISFYTFTQIAFLVDTRRERGHDPRFLDYVLFVAYFPHLVAGPILHHRDTIPQFRRSVERGSGTTDAALGVSIFIIGLAKKVLIADNLAPFADAVFGASMTGAPSFASAWAGALAYTFQIYFDFSGYSEMAIGLSLLFGVRIPLNFASPYRAASVIDFWRRWHMSLSRFLRDYLYISLGGNRRGAKRRHLNLMLTMLLGGLWHGAGWTFVLWGGLHGFYLVANHLLRAVRPPRPDGDPAWSLWAKRFVTFIAVVIAWVVFRAETPSSALRVLAGMSGMGGDDVPFPGGAYVVWAWSAGCLAIVWLLPGVHRIFATHRVTTEIPASVADGPAYGISLWRPNSIWAICLAFAAATVVLVLSEYSPFLYFRF